MDDIALQGKGGRGGVGGAGGWEGRGGGGGGIVCVNSLFFLFPKQP